LSYRRQEFGYKLTNDPLSCGLGKVAQRHEEREERETSVQLDLTSEARDVMVWREYRKSVSDELCDVMSRERNLVSLVVVSVSAVLLHHLGTRARAPSALKISISTIHSEVA
jgi:hypothetical protein